MSSLCQEEGYFLLPNVDGSTIILSSRKSSNDPPARVFRKYDVYISDGDEEGLGKYLVVFPGEAKLKVALFEEMLRTMPAWTESMDPWYRELRGMAAAGISVDGKSRTDQENLVLEWLLLAITEPKIREVHKTTHICPRQSSLLALLELAGESSPLPSKAFLLEYSDTKTNDVSYAFLCAEPGELMSLLFDFAEAGLGRCFTKALDMAMQRLEDMPSFPLWGEVCPRYRCLLMMEFLSHPGVIPVEELRERSSTSAMLQNPGLHMIADTTQARVMAVLLYDTAVDCSTVKSSGSVIVAGVWMMTAVHVLYTIYRLF